MGAVSMAEASTLTSFQIETASISGTGSALLVVPEFDPQLGTLQEVTLALNVTAMTEYLALPNLVQTPAGPIPQPYVAQLLQELTIDPIGTRGIESISPAFATQSVVSLGSGGAGTITTPLSFDLSVSAPPDGLSVPSIIPIDPGSGFSTLPLSLSFDDLLPTDTSTTGVPIISELALATSPLPAPEGGIIPLTTTYSGSLVVIYEYLQHIGDDPGPQDPGDPGDPTGPDPIDPVTPVPLPAGVLLLLSALAGSWLLTRPTARRRAIG
jgi:hypothetical protein